jgi:hypothetical protein
MKNSGERLWTVKRSIESYSWCFVGYDGFEEVTKPCRMTAKQAYFLAKQNGGYVVEMSPETWEMYERNK